MTNAPDPIPPDQPPPPTPPTTSDAPPRVLPRVQDGVRWPYPWHVYFRRAVWAVVQQTVWRVGWARFVYWRPLLLWAFGADVPRAAMIAGSVRVHQPWELSLGRHVAIGPRTHLYNLGGLRVGDGTVISQDVYVCGGTHDYTEPTMPLVRRPVVIGSHVWIAAGAFIGPGVTIGDGAVVGARAVVVKDVAPWTVVAGNPARAVKRREMRPAAND